MSSNVEHSISFIRVAVSGEDGIHRSSPSDTFPTKGQHFKKKK